MVETQLAVIAVLCTVAAAQAAAVIVLSYKVAHLTDTVATLSDKLLTALMSDRAGFRQVKIETARAASDIAPENQIGFIGPDPEPTSDGVTVKYQ
jgi:hypothetical protein